MVTKYTLEEWRSKIKKEVPYVDIKPYSHNIISLALGAIHENFGIKESNKAIKDFKLEDLGWHELKDGE